MRRVGHNSTLIRLTFSNKLQRFFEVLGACEMMDSAFYTVSGGVTLRGITSKVEARLSRTKTSAKGIGFQMAPRTHAAALRCSAAMISFIRSRNSVTRAMFDTILASFNSTIRTWDCSTQHLHLLEGLWTFGSGLWPC